MQTAYVVVTILAAAMTAFSAGSEYFRAPYLAEPMKRLRLPDSWRVPLSAVKAAGAVGLLVGLFIPPIGVAAAIGVVLYFVGAVLWTLRVRWYAHLPVPVWYMAPAAASLVLGFAA
jgi:hypothetical protein